VVAVFIFVAGASDARRQMVMGVVGARSVFEAMQPVRGTVTAFTPLDSAMSLLEDQPELPALPVLFGERVVGVVHRQPVVMATLGQVAVSLGDLVDRNVVTQDGDGPLVALLLRMRAARSTAAVILRGEEVAGVLTLEQVAAAVREALHGGGGKSAGRG
jgi:CBS domain-containing protein